MKCILLVRSVITLSVTLLILLLASGCGGGFKGDSLEAKELGESIFGPDSAR